MPEIALQEKCLSAHNLVTTLRYREDESEKTHDTMMSKSTTLLAATSALLASLAPISAQTPPEPSSAQALEKAIFEADAAGNLDVAIAGYRQLLADTSLPATTRERATWRLGEALRQVGQLDDSNATFKDYLVRFPKGTHAAEARERLRQPKTGADIAALVELLGLWESDGKVLELMPEGRYQRLATPLDHPDLDAPPAPSESGSYEIEEGSLLLKPDGGEGQTLKWTLIGETLTLKPDAGSEQRYARTVRPFRFPRDVDVELEQLIALVFLKLSEAAAVREFLSIPSPQNEKKTAAARDMIALSGAVDTEIRRLSTGTTAEFTCLVTLELFDLAASLLEQNDEANAFAVLAAIGALDWDNHALLAGPFRSAPTLHGTWNARAEKLEMRVSGNNTIDMTGYSRNESEYNLNYTTAGDRLLIRGSDGHMTSEHVFLLDQNRLGLYDLGSGALGPEFKRSLQAGISEDYFAVHQSVLVELLPIAGLARVRSLIADYLYTASTQTDGTTAGLLARTGLRQILQIDAAYASGNTTKGEALIAALKGTLSLLLSGDLVEAALPSELDALGYIDGQRSTLENPYFSIYDGSTVLQPVGAVLPDLAAISKRTDALRQHIVEADLIGAVLKNAPETVRENFLSAFEEMDDKAIHSLLTDTMELHPIEVPPGVALSVFAHHDASIAAQLGNALSELIAQLPPDNDYGAWEIAERAEPTDLPLHLLLPTDRSAPRTYPEPAPTEVRGVHPELAHGRFVYEAYVSHLFNGQQATVPEGRFALVEMRGQLFALRRDGGNRISIVSSESEERAVEPHELEWGDGPGGRRGFVRYGELAFLCDPQLSSPNGYLSVALTPWTEDEQIRFDDPSLRWYLLHTQ